MIDRGKELWSPITLNASLCCFLQADDPRQRAGGWAAMVRKFLVLKAPLNAPKWRHFKFSHAFLSNIDPEKWKHEAVSCFFFPEKFLFLKIDIEK